MTTEDRDHGDIQIQFIPQAYDEYDGEASTLRLLYALYPDWASRPGSVKIKPFTEGIMNTLLKLSKERPHRPDSDSENEAILLRAYGNGSNILVDRDMEARTHTLLTQQGLAAPLLARFQNGLLYRFTPGRACTPQDLSEESIWRAVAAKLGEWHAQLPLPKQEPGNERNIWTVLKQWVAALPDDESEVDKRKKILEKELQRSMVELREDEIKDRDNFVLGHCDLLSANIIIPTDDVSGDDLSRTVNFIDYEYAMPCPVAFDLANHFSEWGGFECDYTMLPTRTLRRSFIEHYLESCRTHTANHSSQTATATVDRLLSDVDSYRGIPGLYWGLHALIQARISHIDFDWSAYAERRLGEYWAWREELDGTREKKGEELPLRERKWAQES